MSFNRRPDRRPSGPRSGGPSGPRSGGFRPERRDFDRSAGAPRGDRPPYRDDRGERGDRGDRPERGYAPRGDRPERSYPPRGDRPPFRDEGGMNLRLDPRHLGQLKRFAGEAGLRPGELAMQWIVERLDAESGRPGPQATGPDLSSRLDELSSRIEALEARVATPAVTSSPAAPAEPAVPEAANAEPEAAAEPDVAPAAARQRQARTVPGGERVGLHEEIAAVIRERGPLSAAELATAIGERGRYVAPRSTKPLDAATVNSRVSNPAYRGRFTRSDGRIGLADAG